jgi:DNA uptake protein ComE-like DNA-binding protein
MMRRSFHRASAPRRGSVLIVTLWASLGLVSVALLFGHSMLMTYRGADNDLAGRQADQAIDGAIRYAETLFISPTTPGEFPDLTTYSGEAMPVGEATAWFLGRAQDSANGTIREFGLVDEASKLNLNTATVEMLQQLPGMTDELAASIIDWRDSNDEVTDNGAEAGTYLAQQPSYGCKNAPFESIEELAWVHGATRLILYGEDANLNGVLDPNEDDGSRSLPEDNADGKLDPGILEYVTVFSRESNKREDGSDRTNVSQFNDQVRAMLTETFGEARGQEIAGRFGPTARVRSPLEFYARSGMTPEEFAQISDSITTNTGDYVQGLVNVNTASEQVLACIPGIGYDKAGSVVATRLTRGYGDTSIAWLLDVLGEEGAVQAGPYVTGKSFQCSADVAAVGRHGRGYRRARVIIDHASDTPKIVYRRDLSSLGWALGSEVRQQAVWKEQR